MVYVSYFYEMAYVFMNCAVQYFGQHNCLAPILQ